MPHHSSLLLLLLWLLLWLLLLLLSLRLLSYDLSVGASNNNVKVHWNGSIECRIITVSAVVVVVVSVRIRIIINLG